MSSVRQPDTNFTSDEDENALGGAGGQPAAAGITLESVRREFEELGLSTYEARILLALLRLGSGTPGQLARSADVPRTSAYQVLEELRDKGLAERMPTGGPAMWGSRGGDEVLAQLQAAQEERLRDHKSRSERLREMLAEMLPEAPLPNLPYVQVIHEPARVRPMYEEMLSEAASELLVFNRPPYSWTLGTPNPIVVETAQRVEARVLYQAAQVGDPAADMWRQEMEAYHAAGVAGRVVDHLPLKLAVVDRKVALLTIDDPVLPHVGFPTTLLIEHPAFAEVQAAAFDHLWEKAAPYPQVAPPSKGGAPDA